MAFRSRVAYVNPVAIPFDPQTLRAGAPTLVDTRNNIRIPSDVSPDGKQIVYFSIGEHQEDLFVGPINGPIRRVTDDAARERAPMFMPDGKSLLFYSNREAGWGIWTVGVDGGGLRKIATPPTGAVYPFLSPNGDDIVFVDNSGRSAFLISVERGDAAPSARRDAGRKPLSFAHRMVSYGKRVAGTLNAASGSAGVGVYNLATNVTTPLSDDVTYGVKWLPDGRRLLCFGKSGRELVVYDTVTRARTVVDVRLPGPAVDDVFALSPDGRTIYYGAARTEADIWIVEYK